MYHHNSYFQDLFLNFYGDTILMLQIIELSIKIFMEKRKANITIVPYICCGEPSTHNYKIAHSHYHFL
ncbi:hypothetical protein IC582_020718 [Cucumis melo]